MTRVGTRAPARREAHLITIVALSDTSWSPPSGWRWGAAPDPLAARLDQKRWCASIPRCVRARDYSNVTIIASYEGGCQQPRDREQDPERAVSRSSDGACPTAVRSSSGRRTLRRRGRSTISRSLRSRPMASRRTSSRGSRTGTGICCSSRGGSRRRRHDRAPTPEGIEAGRRSDISVCMGTHRADGSSTHRDLDASRKRRSRDHHVRTARERRKRRDVRANGRGREQVRYGCHVDFAAGLDPGRIVSAIQVDDDLQLTTYSRLRSGRRSSSRSPRRRRER